jgi:DsrE/DsrF/DrsH-like family
MAAKIEKVSIIISKGSLEGIYPGLIMANGARTEGMEANLFFTFFGLDAIHKVRHEHIKLATVGNPGLSRARSLPVTGRACGRSATPARASRGRCLPGTCAFSGSRIPTGRSCARYPMTRGWWFPSRSVICPAPGDHPYGPRGNCSQAPLHRGFPSSPRSPPGRPRPRGDAPARPGPSPPLNKPGVSR